MSRRRQQHDDEEWSESSDQEAEEWRRDIFNEILERELNRERPNNSNDQYWGAMEHFPKTASCYNDLPSTDVQPIDCKLSRLRPMSDSEDVFRWKESHKNLFSQTGSQLSLHRKNIPTLKETTPTRPKLEKNFKAAITNHWNLERTKFEVQKFQELQDKIPIKEVVIKAPKSKNTIKSHHKTLNTSPVRPKQKTIDNDSGWQTATFIYRSVNKKYDSRYYRNPFRKYRKQSLT